MYTLKNFNRTATPITTAWIYWEEGAWLISVQDGNWNWYTLRDRNEWATNVWDVWCYYQWGNNYWFIWSNGAISNWTVSSTRIDASWYAASTYSSSSYINTGSVQDWSTSKNDDLWWDTTNTNLARKWPCSSWFHVPSYAELNWVYSLIKNTRGKSFSDINNYLKFPNGWDINNQWNALSNTSSPFIWTSTPSGSDAYRYTSIFNIGIWWDTRCFGESVRAFKNNFSQPQDTRTVIYQHS